MKTSTARVRNTIACRVREDLRRAGLDEPAILRQVGIKSAQLSRPDGWLRYEDHAQLLELAARYLKDPSYGLHLAGLIPTKDFGVLAYVGLASRNLGDGLRNLERYVHVQNEAWYISVTKAEKTVTLDFQPAIPSFSQFPQAIEASLGILLNAYSHFLGQRLLPLSVGFVHAQSLGGSKDEAERNFGCPVYFQRNRVQITLNGSALDLPFKTADDRLLAILKEHCNVILKGRHGSDEGIVGDVRTHIAETVSLGNCTAQAIGKLLGLPERTLHRKLAEAGTSFRALLEDTRKELAQRYLQEEGFSLKQTAFLLGYSDPSSFGAAYRRWTGASPKAAKSAAAKNE